VPGKFKANDYWLTSGAYTKQQLEKIARTIVQYNSEYDSYDISYSYSHGKKRAQLTFLKGPHLEFRCHHVIIKN
jgi:hypothetical protein